MPQYLPPLYALRAFERAAYWGSFTRAADELNITQSAVSKHIKTLESHFSCQLFVRSGHKITLTPHGKMLAQDLQAAFKIMENACQIFNAAHSTIRLKAPTSLMSAWLLNALKEYKKENPVAHIQAASVWMDNDYIDFLSEPFDCAILLSDGNFNKEINSIKLFDEWLIPICSPSLLKTNQTINLLDYDLIHPSPDKRDWKRWLAGVGYSIALPMAAQIFDTLEQAAHAAEMGHGISIGDFALCSRSIMQNQLTIPIKKAVKTGDAYYLVMPKNAKKQSPIMDFARFLQSHIPDIQTIDHSLEWCLK